MSHGQVIVDAFTVLSHKQVSIGAFTLYEIGLVDVVQRKT